MQSRAIRHAGGILATTLAAVALALSLAGCGGGGGGGDAQGVQGAAGGRSWTFMVYMNADNSLEVESGKDLDEMARAGFSASVATVVERDLKSTDGVDRMVLAENGPRIVQRLPELDMGSAETLADFIDWATTAYPASHYCLVIWNHGTGWRRIEEPLTRGVSYDETNGSYLNMERLKDGVSAGPRLDIVGFDACVMAMIEVAYQIRDSARYMVGSEHDEPASGWDYSAILSRLYSHPQMTAAELAHAIVDSYGAAYSQAGFAATQSAVDLSQVDGFAAAIDEFAGALLDVQSGRSKSIHDARDATQCFSYDDYRDLADFAYQISARVEGEPARAAADLLLSAHSRAIVANAASGPGVGRALGVSVFLPRSREYDGSASNYERTDFAAAAPKWVEFLRTY
jgi:hypothetical protein